MSEWGQTQKCCPANLVRFRQQRTPEYRIQTQITKMLGRDDPGLVEGHSCSPVSRLSNRRLVTAAFAASLDHLVGADEDGGRDGEAKCTSGLQVDH